ncbi:hypothetical protein KFK09_001640 [Dendrobium nobile]|uniref:Uncharacterized protein n=1 Tax=Dendrobium nobile TaxID=94219 RepID=A0A8T3C8R5_DENNO|nr:hypothetical protein KFK09_001640 [Dendrobium nobile]
MKLCTQLISKSIWSIKLMKNMHLTHLQISLEYKIHQNLNSFLTKNSEKNHIKDIEFFLMKAKKTRRKCYSNSCVKSVRKTPQKLHSFLKKAVKKKSIKAVEISTKKQ